MKVRKPKVAFATNIIPHYRKSFYEKLCSHSSYEWLIFRGKKDLNDGRPDYKGQIDIPQTFVENEETKVGPYTIRWQKGLMEKIKVFAPDMIILLGIGGTVSTWVILLWSKMLGIRTIVWACGWEPQSARSFSLRVKRLFLRIFFSLPDYCLVYSTKAMKYLVGLGVASNKIAVCYNGIEIDVLLEREQEIMGNGLELRKQENLSDFKVFLYVGGMTKEKRVDLLLDAFSGVARHRSDVFLWLVGDGPALSSFKNHAEELGLHNIKFWGRIEDDVDCFFAAADFFVLPGVGGLALNQAMFWKTPCICTDADGTEEDLVVDGVSGKRFDRDDVESLSSNIRSCLDLDGKEKEVWGDNCRKIIMEQSNVNVMVDLFIKTLHRL